MLILLRLLLELLALLVVLLHGLLLVLLLGLLLILLLRLLLILLRLLLKLLRLLLRNLLDPLDISVGKLWGNLDHVDWVDLGTPVIRLLDNSKILWRSLDYVNRGQGVRSFVAATDASVYISFNDQTVFAVYNFSHCRRGLNRLIGSVAQLNFRHNSLVLSLFLTWLHPGQLYLLYYIRQGVGLIK